jgi:hypothetical protein
VTAFEQNTRLKRTITQNQQEMLDAIGRMMAPFGVNNLKIGNQELQLRAPKSLSRLDGYGEAIKVGDHVDITITENGRSRLDLNNARITYIEPGCVSFEPAFQLPRSSNTSTGLNGNFEVQFKVLHEQQGPRPNEENLRAWLETKLTNAEYRTHSGRLSKLGKAVVDRIAYAFCRRKWGCHQVNFHLHGWSCIRKIVRDEKVVRFEAIEYSGRVLT